MAEARRLIHAASEPVAFLLPAPIRLSCLPDLTDAAWEQLRQLVPPPRARRPSNDRRLLMESILCVGGMHRGFVASAACALWVLVDSVPLV